MKSGQGSRLGGGLVGPIRSALGPDGGVVDHLRALQGTSLPQRPSSTTMPPYQDSPSAQEFTTATVLIFNLRPDPSLRPSRRRAHSTSRCAVGQADAPAMPPTSHKSPTSWARQKATTCLVGPLDLSRRRTLLRESVSTSRDSPLASSRPGCPAARYTSTRLQ